MPAELKQLIERIEAQRLQLAEAVACLRLGKSGFVGDEIGVEDFAMASR